jgi:hypothetical protein
MSPEEGDPVTNPTNRTDAQLAELDVEAMLRTGHTALFGDGAVAGAILLDRVETIPRSVSFLAELVRRGGTRHAAELPEPLPTAAQTAVVHPWLAAAATGPSGDERMARWLEAVAAVLALRAANR